MARIVLDIEPQRHWQCPYSKGGGRCKIYGLFCSCIEKVVTDVSGNAINVNYPIDFDKCPCCTTLKKELKKLMEGEI